MRTQAYVRSAAALLSTALLCGGALAQSVQPTTRIDTAPPPAEERGSTGAIVMMDEPVIAQRAAMQTMMARSAPDTRAMGAGPARVVRQEAAREELMVQKLQEALEFHRRGAGALTEK